MSSHGYQMGGTIGFLKTLSRIVAELKPKAIYIAWEGGGSARRRKLFSEYKMNRKPEKLNRFYEDDIPDSPENKKHQLVSLVAFLKNVPACQLYAADCEGDDVMAYLCVGPLKDERKVLVSSDKDMYQLLDDKTTQYSLHKKAIVTKEDVLETFRITTENFAIAKALCGDKGDNISGIKGLGFKTVAKIFPFLGTESKITLQDVFDFCHSHIDKHRFYKKIIEEQENVKMNWKLVYLSDMMISATQAEKLKHNIETFKPRINKMGLMKLLIAEGINDFDIGSFFFSFCDLEGLI